MTTSIMNVAPAVPEYMQACMEELQDAPTEKLREAFTASTRDMLERMIRMAAIIRILEDRQVDLSFVRCGLLHYLRKVAYGQLLPDILVRYQGQPNLLRAISGLTLPEQSTMAGDNPIKVVVLEEQGPTHRLVHPTKLATEEVRQVFARDHIRDEAEQVSFLNLNDRRAPKTVPSNGIVIDQRRLRVIITGKNLVLTAKDLHDLIDKLKS